MKVTPLAQGSATLAGVEVGNERMPADKIAAAKAIAEGKSPMQVAESDTPVDPQVERAKRSLRKIKMKTQVSTDRPIDQVVETPVETAPALTESATPDAVEPTKEASEATKPLSPVLAEIARQKRALQVKERELAEREAKLAQPNLDEYVSKADIAANPLKLFELGVITYDQLTEAILANPQNTEINELRKEIKALKEGVDKSLTDRDAQAEKQVLSEMTREAKQLVAQGNDYELVRENGYVSKAIDLIHKTWKQTGEVLDVSEALGLVENQLLEDALKLANYEKVRTKLTPAQVQQQQQQQSAQMKTLTNRDGAQAPLDKRTRALLAFSGQLRK